MTTVVAGMFVGATTNAVNGAVSPTYFTWVMGWDGFGVWLASIQQGILEGTVIGTLLSLVLTLGIGLITRATCTYLYALRFLLGVVFAVYVTWAVGGAIGVVWAARAPSYFLNTFVGTYLNFRELLRFAWVGGTIWGAYLGGPLAVLISLIVFHFRWRRQIMAESGQ